MQGQSRQFKFKVGKLYVDGAGNLFVPYKIDSDESEEDIIYIKHVTTEGESKVEAPWAESSLRAISIEVQY